MLPAVNGNIQSYIDGLDRIQTELNTVQRQVSSGVRVGLPSDDPNAVPDILQAQTRIGMTTQLQTNLQKVQTELSAGDSALQQAAKLMDQAVTLGTQAASATTTASDYAAMLPQVAAIQQALVGLTATSVNGRFIFGGDSDQQAPYQLDASGPHGVRQTSTLQSTVTITGANGAIVWQPKTAQDVFDARDASGNDAPGNVFAAVSSLITAVKNQDSQGAQNALAALRTASDHVSQQLGLYGIGETNVSDELNAAATQLTSQKQSLGNSRDTDMAAAAEEMSQASLQQQAALSIGQRIYQSSLFNYMS